MDEVKPDHPTMRYAAASGMLTLGDNQYLL